MPSIAPAVRNFVKSLPGYRVWRPLAGSLLDTALGAEDEQWARIVMNRETRKLVQPLNPATLDVLEISGTTWSCRKPFRSYRSACYPEYDVGESALPDTFDLIIAEQVFEHLLWPYRAGRNVHQMLRPGGAFLITTPFLVRIHNYPIDCSRWTELGLKHFLAECGFPLEKVQTGSWGNRACIKANFPDWVQYKAKLHSLRNEPDFPIVVWALARKHAVPT